MRVGNWIKRLWKRRVGKSVEDVRSERSEFDQVLNERDQLLGEKWGNWSVIGALITLVVGIILIFWAVLIEEETFTWSPIVGHLIRDIGITATITASLIISYELLVKKGFIQDAENSLKRVYDKQRGFEKAGLKKIHRNGLPEGLLREGISNTKKEIRILQTWLGFENRKHVIRAMLEEAAGRGCKEVRILLLDPFSDQVWYRAEAMRGRDGDDVNEEHVMFRIVDDLRFLLNDLRPRLEKCKLEVRVYDATPTTHVYEFDGTKLMAVKGRGADAIYVPHFEIDDDPKLPLAREINEDFEDLWEKKLITRDGWDALEEYEQWYEQWKKPHQASPKEYRLCKRIGLTPEEYRQWKSSGRPLKEFLQNSGKSKSSD